MTRAIRDMDPGLQAAVRAAGGERALFRLVGLKRPNWRRVPQDRVFLVAQVTGLDPLALRPDLADWIVGEIERRQLAERSGGASLRSVGAAVAVRWDGPTIDEGLVDLWASLAAVHFVARLRGLKAQNLYRGETRADQAARTYAMALAKVVGRARSTHIASFFQVSRQNVDNATERYLRARDGDDPDDFISGQFEKPKVLERGANRLRTAKDADDSLWPVEERFTAFLGGDLDELPQPERKRA